MHLVNGERRFPKYSCQIRFKKQRMCLALFSLPSPTGVLSGVLCLHVDDMLGTADDQIESKLKDLDKLVGPGSMKRQKFVHSGRLYEKHANGEITISMKPKIHNLKKACVTSKRMKQLDDELSATQIHEFRGINGCWQWVTKEFVIQTLSVRCESAPTRARTGLSARLFKSKCSHR